MRSLTSREKPNPRNSWQYIEYLGGESGVYSVVIDGRCVGQFGALKEAQTARDEALKFPAAAPLTPDLYFNREAYL